MTALLVFESMYGSTAAVAAAVAAGLAELRIPVTVCEVGVAGIPTLDTRPSLLVVGAPTHQRGLPTSRTREAARADVAMTVSRGDGVREWLDQVVAQASGQAVAVFDTALAGRLAGSAAHAIGKRLTRAGAELVMPPESFTVTGRTSGLLPDELGGGAIVGPKPCAVRRRGRRSMTPGPGR